ncbi:MAG: hypothetical protein HQK89_02815 [Nitrospirae bacterium]|nr:hypothetical protein [Nitrospirota bacterium]
MIRVAIALLYAHWEGFVKKAAANYLRFLSGQGLRHDELQPCFVTLSVNNKFKLNQFENQIKVVKLIEVVDFLINRLGTRSEIPYEGIIDASNLNFDVFKEICLILNLEYQKYEMDQKLIDSQLFGKRNKVVHGDGNQVDIDYDEYENIHTKVIGLMRQVKNDIAYSANSKEYLK